jgi:hypothetical protein
MKFLIITIGAFMFVIIWLWLKYKFEKQSRKELEQLLKEEREVWWPLRKIEQDKELEERIRNERL